ncbi:MAG: glycosyltransferase family 4 protein [Candidatus Delongbacteria bacterium]|nr:glycosyltransferase family 4 protein [Candidatus Delongbacteria bacterium]
MKKSKKKNIVFAVYDHLYTEYRGYKVANSFLKSGHRSKVIGIKFDNDKELSAWEGIKVRRIKIYRSFSFPVNMIIYWIKLFFKLLVTKADVIYSHDIFPLLPVYVAAIFKGIPFVYDAHEFWHGNSHIENRPFVKNFWIRYENFFIKRADKVITVSNPIAEELKKIYGLKDIKVFTNLPMIKEIPSSKNLLHEILNIDNKKKIVLYQGHILFNNGLDDVLRAFVNVDKNAVLVLIGEGIEKEKLKELSKELNLFERIFFLNEVPHNELINYTVCADIGLCLIKNSGKSFFWSTPNKMFEYIQAGIPQLASNFPEMSKVVKDNIVGKVIDPSDQKMIYETLNIMLNDPGLLRDMKENCINLGRKYSWDSIEEELVEYVAN